MTHKTLHISEIHINYKDEWSVCSFVFLLQILDAIITKIPNLNEKIRKNEKTRVTVSHSWTLNANWYGNSVWFFSLSGWIVPSIWRVKLFLWFQHSSKGKRQYIFKKSHSLIQHHQDDKKIPKVLKIPHVSSVGSKRSIKNIDKQQMLETENPKNIKKLWKMLRSYEKCRAILNSQQNWKRSFQYLQLLLDIFHIFVNFVIAFGVVWRFPTIFPYVWKFSILKNFRKFARFSILLSASSYLPRH